MKLKHLTLALIPAIIIATTIVFTGTPQSELEVTTDYHSERHAVGTHLQQAVQPLVKGVSTETSEEVASSYMILFNDTQANIGHSVESLQDQDRDVIEEGMYNGGQYYDYGDYTYFVNPETELINAIVIRGDEYDEDWETFDKELADKQVESFHNEMDNLWIDIYEAGEGEIVVERIEPNGEPLYVWYTEEGLFYD
ncbi:hypothetical protein [Alteribacter populi]|uniref:hypothetical protein n=1 Tax=Alteribacter populi TaxID=2011011 RepID=UPI000BBB0BCA|nr:hypothetical protein [Alteribacter populi]